MVITKKNPGPRLGIPALLKDRPQRKAIPALWLTQNSPITSGPYVDLLPLLRGYDQPSENGPKSHTTITISHGEARLCLLIRQFLIPIIGKLPMVDVSIGKWNRHLDERYKILRTR
ncbi:hypothetical protein AVEN_218167-1 [Araneus ventricosus]|uniref:Uncharacterized protein n=1 Tax=Araneus ventricosus TaxID=182803 RepID=A0A4Y2FR79_ARAVE|nr:hypothetical protein AVEN_218167-1 [Araneus ventricosus]